MKAPSVPGLRVVVLAAGFSARLGFPKALARIRGVSLLRGTLELAASLRLGRTVVVVAHNAARHRVEARGIGVQFVGNKQRARGLSSSVRLGIAAARGSRAVLLLPVDLSHLKRRELLRLVSRWRAAPRRVVARRIGKSGATPLILPRWLYARALRIAGDAGLRDWVRQLPGDSLVLADLPSAAFDVDTRQDLQAARQKYRSFA